MCSDIVEIWFEMSNEQISSILTELPACNTSIFSFPDDYLSKYQWILPHLVMALILWRSGLELLMGKF